MHHYLPLESVIGFSLITILMEEAALMFSKLSLKSLIQFILCTNKRFLQLAVDVFAETGLEIWLPSRLLLSLLNLVESPDVEIVLASLVDRCCYETTLEVRMQERHKRIKLIKYSIQKHCHKSNSITHTIIHKERSLAHAPI